MISRFLTFKSRAKPGRPTNVLLFMTSCLACTKGSRKNKFTELALRFGSDLADPIEKNRRNS
jgi:hypothetical protein